MDTTQSSSKWQSRLRTARNPPAYFIASLITACVGLLNGLDTSTIGPVTTMTSFTDIFGSLSPAVHGIVISSVLLPATVASLFAGAIADGLGRSRAISIGTLIFAIGAALEAAASNLGMFVAGRCVVGIGQGVFLSTLVVYVCEISPPKHRGPLATLVQMFITFGLVVGFFTCYGTVNIKSTLSFRLPLALQSGLAFMLTIASTFYLPPSPRWLTYKGRREEASKAWDRLGVSNTEREKDLLQNPIEESGPPERQQDVTLSFIERTKKGWKEAVAMFAKDTRKPMLLGVFLMSMQQLSGIDGVIFYAPLLFNQAGLSSSEAAFLASGVSAILIFVFTMLAVYLVDRWGRRASTIYGGLLLTACMAVMGLLYATNNVHAKSGIGRWIVIITIYVFAVAYSMTWAIGMKLFASEIQPATTRASAVSLAQAANCITNFFVAFITPVLLARSSSGIYFLFGGATFLTVSVSILYMPETVGRDLETIGETFGGHQLGELNVANRLRGLRSRVRRFVRRGGDGSSTSSESIELQDLHRT